MSIYGRTRIIYGLAIIHVITALYLDSPLNDGSIKANSV